jgi:hypothetical protein
VRTRGRQKSNRHGPDSEYSIQKSICELLDLRAPWLLYCASAGGARTSLIEARRMKATGYKKGFPDLFFYEPRGPYSGLAIELKRDKGRATPDQKRWKAELEERGYKAVVARGRQACLDALKEYFAEDNLDL